MNYVDEKRLAFQMPIFDWLMIAEAVDNYITDHANDFDTSQLEKYVEYIEENCL